MNGLINERMIAWMNEWKACSLVACTLLNEWMNEWSNKWLNEWMIDWMNE